MKVKTKKPGIAPVNLKNIGYAGYLIIIAIIFSILFSFYSIFKAYSLNAYGWDLGLYSQAFYSTIHGSLFYTNLLNTSYLSEHFSPVLFLILPIFYIFPSTFTLLVIQDIALGLAAIPLYFISINVFKLIELKYNYHLAHKNRIAFIFALAYLLAPLTESPVFFDFHLMAFLPLFYFISFYFFIRRKNLYNFIFLGLIAALHSNFVFIVAAIVIMELFVSRYLFIWNIKAEKKYLRFMVFAISLLIIYYIFADIMKGYISGTYNINILSTGQTSSASTSIAGTLHVLIYNPLKFFGFIASNFEIKILFLSLAFLSVYFSFYKFWAGLIPVIPYIAYAMTSSYIPYYFIGFQYSMMIIPFVFVAGIIGISKIMADKSQNKKRKIKPSTTLRNILTGMVVFSIVAFIVTSPISPVSAMPNGISHLVNDTQGINGQRMDFIKSVSNDMDKNYSLITGNSLFPLFYTDLHATAFPLTCVNISVPHYKYLIADFSDTQTYLNNSQNISLAGLTAKYLQSGDYGIIAEGYGIIALERGYSGKPLFYEPVNITYNGSQFLIHGNVTCGPVPDLGKSAYAKLLKSGEDIRCTNSTYLLPGNYTIQVNLSGKQENSISLMIQSGNGSKIFETITSTVVHNKALFNFTVTPEELYPYVKYCFVGTGVNGISSMSIKS
jgi:uncharacterized membrane protein